MVLLSESNNGYCSLVMYFLSFSIAIFGFNKNILSPTRLILYSVESSFSTANSSICLVLMSSYLICTEYLLFVNPLIMIFSAVSSKLKNDYQALNLSRLISYKNGFSICWVKITDSDSWSKIIK